MKTTAGQTEQPYHNQVIRRNAIIFAVLTIIFQIAAGLLYGFLIKPVAVTQTSYQPIMVTVGLGLLVIAGFGLMFSYLKFLTWSGIGFTFLITAFTIQLFFLVNALWSWAIIFRGAKPQSRSNYLPDQAYYYFTLTNSSGGNFGNTIAQAFKCALANVVAFSAILGRAGPLQAIIVAFFGTIGYQLNRTIISNYGFDDMGTLTTFIFGGFMGLIVGLFRRYRQRTDDTNTLQHPNYTANKFSSSFALIGTLFTWIFFPLLAFDNNFTGDDQPSNASKSNFVSYIGPLSMIFALTGSTFSSFFTSSALNGKLNIRDIVYGSIAGGVASATASIYITNPVYAILIGVVAGMVQVLGQNYIQKKWAQENNIINTVSFILFGVQGLIGAAFAAGWNAIISTNSNGFIYSVLSGDNSLGLANSYWQFLMGLHSAAFGIGIGIFAGIFVMLVAGHQRFEHFDDFTYWQDDDGIRFDNIQQPMVPDQVAEIEFKEGDNDIKNVHAYL